MIWKALSDPTRRSILNLLKNAPRTTGEISDQFKDLSRYAVMKHLGVLEKADLITIKREGKFRWNYLNPTPIQKTYEKWVSNLVQLSLFTDSTTRKMGQNKHPAYTSKLTVSATFKSPQEKVWKTLTKDISRWWVAECYTHPDTRKVILEVKPGGLLYEDIGNKEGFVWGMVMGIHQPYTLLLKGQISAKLGGPALSFINISLESKQQHTKLQVTEVVLGQVSDRLLKSLRKHWKTLLEKGMRPLLDQ